MQKISCAHRSPWRLGGAGEAWQIVPTHPINPQMKAKEFFRKFLDKRLWLNLLGMAVVLLLLFLGLRYGLDRYTLHGEEIAVPDVRGKGFGSAKALVEAAGLRIAVNDTGYNKRMPADCILLQNPAGGARVKLGRVVYVTVNSESTPTLTIPDIIDNCSRREAEAQLKAMGFRVLDAVPVDGEKDWVYGIKANGRHVYKGDRVPIDVTLRLEVGSGAYDDSTMAIDYVDPDFEYEEGSIDEFEVVAAPPAEDGGSPAPEGGDGQTDTEVIE